MYEIRILLSQADTVSSVPNLIDRDMVKETISKPKSEKAAGPSGVLSEMVRAAGEARVHMITELIIRL